MSKLNWDRVAREHAIERWGSERAFYLRLEDEEWVPLQEAHKDPTIEVIARHELLKVTVHDLGICKEGEDCGKHLYELEVPRTKPPVSLRALMTAIRQIR